MNDDYPLDDVLRAWADTGEERLPAAYLDAALAQIETTRQRGARWAPLEDLIMRFQALAAPVAIVAVLVMAIVALALLTGPPNVGPDATPTPSPSATTAANSSPTPEPTPEATASPTPVPSTSEAATRLLDAGWSGPFTMTVPSNWQRSQGPLRPPTSSTADSGRSHSPPRARRPSRAGAISSRLCPS